MFWALEYKLRRVVFIEIVNSQVLAKITNHPKPAINFDFGTFKFRFIRYVGV